VTDAKTPWPDWYRDAPYRFLNVHGEEWAARIEVRNNQVCVDLTGNDVGFSVHTVAFSRPENVGLKEPRDYIDGDFDALRQFGWVLNFHEHLFVLSVVHVARARTVLLDLDRSDRKS
jgi:hypothetical protein